MPIYTRQRVAGAAMFENCCIGRHIALSKMYYTIGLSIKSGRRERADRLLSLSRSFAPYLAFVIVRVLKRLPRWRRIPIARHFGRFRQDTGSNVCELNFTSEENGSVSEISTVVDRYLKEREREGEPRVESFLARKKKKKKTVSFGGKGSREIGERLFSRVAPGKLSVRLK